MTYVQILTLAAQKVGLKASLLISICTVESNLKNVSNLSDPNGGSHGICQVALTTAKEIEPKINTEKLQDPVINSNLAAKILKQKIKKYGLILGIASYNSGSPKYRNNKLINSNYVAKVLNLYYNKYYEE